MKKILIIDDSESTRAAIETILTTLGHQVVSVANGKAALGRLQSDAPFDLLITDIFMPEMDGIEVIEHVKNYYPDTRIIAMSAGGMGMKGEEMLEIASGLGAEHIVRKPFSPDDISTAVHAALP